MILLIEPNKGQLLIDGDTINSSNIKNWQKNIALVPQTIFLNDATILENIAIGEKCGNQSRKSRKISS